MVPLMSSMSLRVAHRVAAAPGRGCRPWRPWPPRLDEGLLDEVLDLLDGGDGIGMATGHEGAEPRLNRGDYVAQLDTTAMPETDEDEDEDGQKAEHQH